MIVVAGFAPVRHTWPYGTSSPMILRPRMCGLLYLTSIVPPATVTVAVAGGLGKGSSGFAGVISIAPLFAPPSGVVFVPVVCPFSETHASASSTVKANSQMERKDRVRNFGCDTVM